jgi:hypothetical protein
MSGTTTVDLLKIHTCEKNFGAHKNEAEAVFVHSLFVIAPIRQQMSGGTKPYLPLLIVYCVLVVRH